MRNNNLSINIKDLGIMKFPNINYFLSNAPYHEIIDTAIIRESKESDKEKDIKFERMKDITKQILIGSEIAVKLKDVEQYSKIAPELSKDKDIIEVMTITETLLEQDIHNIKNQKEIDAKKL